MLQKVSESKPLLLLIPNLGFGGAQRVFYDHSLLFSQQHTVYECVFNRDQERVYATDNPMLSLEVAGGGNALAKGLNFVKRCVRLRGLKRKYNVGVSISHLEGADYVNVLSKNQERVILCIHGSKLHDRNIAGAVGWLRKRVLLPWLYRRADLIVTVSDDIRQELISAFRIPSHKCRTIYNFFDLEAIRTRSRASIPAEYQPLFGRVPVLVTSGRLAKQKNQAPLLAIFAALRKRIKCRLVIIGDGELRNELLEQAVALSLSCYSPWLGETMDEHKEVYFLGYQENPHQFIARSDIFVFPSAWEGFPMALGEAMACGAPVVSSACPTGPREMLGGEDISAAEVKAVYAEYGVLMPIPYEEQSETLQAWVEVLEQLLRKPNVRQHYGQRAQERMKDFSREKITEQWLELIG